MSPQDILFLIKQDEWMMNVLRIAEELDLPDWAIGAGFVRNKVWDHLHGISRERVATADIDLVYFDAEHVDQQSDEILSKRLYEETGFVWEVVNEAYAAAWNQLPPYISTEDAISQWPETATCIGVRSRESELELIAPHGTDDLVGLIVRPSPAFLQKTSYIQSRAEKKNWLGIWPKLVFAAEPKDP